MQYDSGNPGYDTDWNNFAPNVGAAWRPNVQGGWLRALLGDPEQATVRAGYSLAFVRERMDRFTNLYSANPGAAINTNRTGNQGNLVLPGESWPITLSQSDRLGPPTFPDSPAYPLTPSLVNGDDINIFDPAIRVPYTKSWSIGFQRSISDDMAVDIRYVGTRLANGWTTENWNEINVFENGFLDEFRLAQANLRAHVAAGCGAANNPCSFAYRGAGTGTSPLPTYLAYFARIPGARAGDPASYSGVTQFSNSAWTGHLGECQPDPVDAGNDLHANATLRANALAAGLPANFFVLNPDVDQRQHHPRRGADEVRRAPDRLPPPPLARFDGVEQLHLRQDLRRPISTPSAATAPSSSTTTTCRTRSRRQWTYEIPVGRGKRFGSDMNPWLNGIIGNWEFSGTGRLQNRDVPASTSVAAGRHDEGRAAEGRSRSETVETPSGRLTVFSLPQDIIDNTRRACNTDPTSATGYSADGAPTGRYIAPASAPGCIAVYAERLRHAAQDLRPRPAVHALRLQLQEALPVRRASASFELQLSTCSTSSTTSTSITDVRRTRPPAAPRSR